VVKREAQGFAVEVPPGQDLTALGQNRRVVDRRGKLGFEGCPHVADPVPVRTMYLGHAAERIGILHEMVGMLVAVHDLAAGEKRPEVRSGLRRAGVLPQADQFLVEGGVRTEAGLESHGSCDVGNRRKLLGAVTNEDPQSEHALGPVDERESFLE
jgi:hypothetical protein